MCRCVCSLCIFAIIYESVRHQKCLMSNIGNIWAVQHILTTLNVPTPSNLFLVCILATPSILIKSNQILITKILLSKTNTSRIKSGFSYQKQSLHVDLNLLLYDVESHMFRSCVLLMSPPSLQPNYWLVRNREHCRVALSRHDHRVALPFLHERPCANPHTPNALSPLLPPPLPTTQSPWELGQCETSCRLVLRWYGDDGGRTSCCSAGRRRTHRMCEPCWGLGVFRVIYIFLEGNSCYGCVYNL
jgi:hypothetical protein